VLYASSVTTKLLSLRIFTNSRRHVVGENWQLLSVAVDWPESNLAIRSPAEACNCRYAIYSIGAQTRVKLARDLYFAPFRCMRAAGTLAYKCVYFTRQVEYVPTCQET
jgi:hypothetical protein